MKKCFKQFLVSFLCLVIVLVSIVPIQAVEPTSVVDSESSDDEKVYCNATINDLFAEDCVIVVLNSELGGINKIHLVSDFDAFGIASVEDLTAISYNTPEATAENSLISQIDEENYRQILKLNLSAPSKENVLQIIRQLEQMDGIIYAGPNYRITFDAQEPNYDSTLSSQWGLQKIQAPKAWEITTGSSSVKVGVIDTGIANHFDLEDNLTSGWDYIRDEAGGIYDPFLHGTHVAGIIGAQESDQEDVVGVAWNVTLVPLRVGMLYFNESSETYYVSAEISDIIEAINYATNNNVPILNLSISTPGYYYEYKRAIANYPGLLVCSAGNEQDETAPRDIDEYPTYPSAFNLENVISVANSDQDDGLNDTSNYGDETVHLVAPGTDIISTVPKLLIDEETHNATWIDTYATDSGTSMAAPHVTGVAALIKSIRPDLSATEIKALILDNVDVVLGLGDKCITGGRLNAYKAVLAATEAQTFTGDVNGDNKADMILSRNVNGKRAFTVYLGQANGGFAEPITTQSTRNFFYDDPAFVGDFDGDQDTDILIHWSNSNNKRQLLVYRSNGDGTFQEGINLSSTRTHDPELYPCSFYVADVNGDGKDDFVVHWRTAGGKRSTLVYKGTDEDARCLIDATTIALTTDDPYSFTESVFMGDFDGDDCADMLVHGVYGDQQNKRQLRIYRGRSDGTFEQGKVLQSTRTHAPELYPASFYVTDVNNDQRDDFVVHWRNSNGKRCNLVYKGSNTEPYLLDATTIAMTSNDTYVDSDPVFVGDFNGDDYSDMLVHWKNSNNKRQLLLYTGKSDGTYNTGVNTSTSNTHNPAAFSGSFYVADVDGDGRDDFIVKWHHENTNDVNFLTYRWTSNGFTVVRSDTFTTEIPYFNAS